MTPARQLFAAHIKTYRKELGLSQEAFADKLNITRDRLSRYETMKRGITLETLYTWALELNVPLRDLVPNFKPIG